MTETATPTVDDQQIREMFDRIAGVYDRMNTVMTAGLHQRWRQRAVELTLLKPGDHALDVATGTGDLALALEVRVGPDGVVVGSDFSENMLKLARAKAPHLRWECDDALDLPYTDASFDAVTVGFGVRNFADLDKGLSELVRVTRSGGRVIVLELTRPTRQPLSSFFSVWFDGIVPLLGHSAGDSSAYSYLPQSVQRFSSPDELAKRLSAVGLIDIKWVITGGGAVAIHAGTVRSTSPPGGAANVDS